MIKESPIEKFKGTITIPDYLNIMQVRMFEDSLPTKEMLEQQLDPNTRIWISVDIEKKLPVILSFVSEWNLEGIPKYPTLETFPASPTQIVGKLVDWIYKEIYKLWVGEIEIPNE